MTALASGQITSQVTHIGIESSETSPGGLNRFVDDLVAAQSAGRPVRAIRLTPPADQRHGSQQGSGPGQLRQRSQRGRWRDLRQQYELHLPETALFDCHFAFNALPGLLRPGRRSRLERPMVMHFHGPWAAESAAMGASPAAVRVKHLIERTVFRRAQEFVTLSETFQDTLIGDYGVPAERVHVVPPGVDTTVFRPLGTRTDARELLGLPMQGPLIVAVRRLVPRMGLQDLIHCVAQLPGVQLAIVGEGPQREELATLAQQTAPGRVHFLGRLPDKQLPLAYTAADLSVVPSRELEGFGLVALESLACGTPAVARPQGGLRTALAGLPDGLALGMSLPELKEAIVVMLRRPPTSAACRRYASTWSWERSVARLDDVYASATDRWLCRGMS